MTIYRKCEGRYVETEVDGELVLMNTATGRFFALEDSALAIWRAIDGNRDLATIADELAERFGTDAATVASDSGEFLADLVAAGLVEAIPAGHGGAGRDGA
ncbi:HPr-rel-A system PqqD family peptide chaperone [Croceicoccus sp. BE223]|uniref:HPr-rel-A system PqqD family peptide chaperone n=1 Tax=Croceicoccus sp. BE223 TaxID=2817716 RepID=UPI002863C430|nr:HPr-rel-A system PqqD family peptide chaperone [Croceicoccus sp. BE223]MDR7100881.1 PqqD family protein of HPr-rel-A system [Croceicoccus sp. BE223]